VIEIAGIRAGLVGDDAIDRRGLAGRLASAEGDALTALQEDAGAVALP
jgi:hypothetical protein